MTINNTEPAGRSTTISVLILSIIAVVSAALIAALVSPVGLPSLLASLADPAQHSYWYLSRGSGIVAYLIIWLSTALGLMVTNKLGRLWPGGPATVDLHEFTGLLGMAFSVFHVLILLGDQYIGYTLGQLLIPFASSDYRPLWVGLGQVGLYLGLPVTFAFYVRQRIGYRTWRLLHYASFGVYLLTGAHGILAGTDSSTLLVRGMYLVTGGSIYFLTIYRILVTIKRPRALPETA